MELIIVILLNRQAAFGSNRTQFAIEKFHATLPATIDVKKLNPELGFE